MELCEKCGAKLGHRQKRFCSLKCSWDWMRREIPKKCERCGAKFMAREWKDNQGKAKFCSPECGLEARRENQIGKSIHSEEDRAKRRERIAGTKNPMFGRFREANPNWGGGKTVDHRFGYVLVLAPDHPRAHKPYGYVYEHVLVAEKKIGRFLTPEERVHHIDGNPKNNSPENLDVFSGDKEHAEIHDKRRERNELGQYS